MPFVLPLFDVRETARCLKLIGIGIVDFVCDYRRARQYRVFSRKSPQGIKERLLLGCSEEVTRRQCLISWSSKQRPWIVEVEDSISRGPGSQYTVLRPPCPKSR